MIQKSNDFNDIYLTEDFNPFDLNFDTDLEEDIEKHEVLNPKLWTEDAALKPEVLEKIQAIVEQFLTQLQEDGIKINIKDIILVGSNCSYNYTKDSDLDIHILADTSSLECPDNLYPLLYSAYRSLFNSKYNITFYGIPVEIYVELDDSPRISNGCYSVLNQKWISEPVQADIPEIDMDKFNSEFEVWENKYNNLLKGTTTPSETIKLINQLIEQVYELRKTGLAEEGEYSIKNLLFKEFRNRGYLDKLKELKNELIGQELSLESLKEKYSDFWKSAEQDTLIENGDWNKSKNMCIAAVQQYEGAKIQKIAGQKYAKYAAVWHHLNGHHDYFNFKNYVLIVDWDTNTANVPEIAHKCIHCYALLEAAKLHEAADSLLSVLQNLDTQLSYYLFNQFSNAPQFPTKQNLNKNLDSTIYSIYKCTNFNDYWTKVGDLLVNYYKTTINIGSDEGEAVGTMPMAAGGEPITEKALFHEDTKKIKDHKWVNKGKAGTHGTFKTKREADAQRKAMFANGWHESLEEDLDSKLEDYAKQIQTATNYFPIMQENGLFEIYNLSENTVNLTLMQIKNLEFVQWVQKAVTNFNASALALSNVPQRKYKIYGQVKL